MDEILWRSAWIYGRNDERHSVLIKFQARQRIKRYKKKKWIKK